MAVPDDDDLAAKYELADDLFTAAGLHWYEVSNWARARPPAAATTRLLEGQRLVGRGSGRAL